MKIIVYGPSGVGKTTLAKTIPEPTLIISAEAGLMPLADCDIDTFDISLDDEGKVIPKEKRINRLKDVAKYLTTDEAKKYKWLFIDSISEIGQNLVEELKSKPEYQDPRKMLPMWGEYYERMKGLIKSFRDLPGFNIVLTALSTVEKDESNRRFIGIDLNGKISSQIMQFFDGVFYYDVSVNEEGEQVRSLITQPNGQLICKDRSGKLENQEVPDLAIITQKMRGEL